MVIAAHAYGVTEVEGGGLQHIVKQLGSGEDPLNQRSTVGWKAIKTAERLVEQYMIRIESCGFKAGTVTANWQRGWVLFSRGTHLKKEEESWQQQKRTILRVWLRLNCLKTRINIRKTLP